MDRGARQVTLHRVAKIQTRLSDWVHTHICTHIWCIYTCMPIYICMHTYWQLFCLLQEIHVFSFRDCEAESTNPFRGGWAFSSFPPQLAIIMALSHLWLNSQTLSLGCSDPADITKERKEIVFLPTPKPCTQGQQHMHVRRATADRPR